MSDELLKAARELLEAINNCRAVNLSEGCPRGGFAPKSGSADWSARMRDAVSRQSKAEGALYSASAEPNCPKMLDSSEPSREPTREMIEAWVKEAGCTRNHDLFRFAALAYAAGHKAGSGTSQGEIHIVFDGPPSHDSPRFIEVEDANGKSIRVGEWEHRGKYWHLVVYKAGSGT